ncbi:MAG: lycopene cyclase domain-containing protein [Dehalococcoidia bacterium]
MGRSTYLALLLGWALPVVALHWVVGAPELRRRFRVLVPAVLAPTAYLVLVDTVAVSSGAWHISDDLTVGWRWGGLVLEEALFFFLTNVMVAQSVILFTAKEPRARLRRLLTLRWRRRPARSGSGPTPNPRD